MPTKTINFRGKEYKTLKDLARAHDIEYHLITGRLATGHTLEQAIDKGKSTLEVTLYNKTYKSLVHLSKELGIRYDTLVNRLDTGMTLEQAVDHLLNTEPIVFNNVTYPTVTALCLEYQMDIINFRGRMSAGWTVHDALLTPVKQVKRKKQITYQGRTFNSKRELAEHFGYTRSLIDVHRVILGVEFTETITVLNAFLSRYGGNRPPLINKIPYVIYGNHWFPLLQDLCDHISVEPRKLKMFRKGYTTSSLHDALTKMSVATTQKIVDNQTREVTTIKDMQLKYKKDARDLERLGYFSRVPFKTFPDMNFNKDFYFVTPEAHYKEFLEHRNKH